MRLNAKANFDKAINNFIGIIEGIAIDANINENEVFFLNRWLDENKGILHKHPFNELAPLVQAAIHDRCISSEERADILWLCEKLTSNDYYCYLTGSIQRLHGILGGIASDLKITEYELHGLRRWLNDHEHLKSVWPYDEVDSLVMAAMADGKIDAEEHKILINFFMEFSSAADDRTLTAPTIAGENVFGVCAACPEIEFSGKTFCFTGESAQFKRKELQNFVAERGGNFVKAVSPKVNYLIVCANGNPNWAYACYGRKIEQAVHLRKSGLQLVIVHENDFRDALQD